MEKMEKTEKCFGKFMEKIFPVFSKKDYLNLMQS